MKDSSKYRAMEGSVELEFCNDEGEFEATFEQQEEFLLKEGFSKEEVEEFITTVKEM